MPSNDITWRSSFSMGCAEEDVWIGVSDVHPSTRHIPIKKIEPMLRVQGIHIEGIQYEIVPLGKYSHFTHARFHHFAGPFNVVIQSNREPNQAWRKSHLFLLIFWDFRGCAGPRHTE
jgi:hypothetical protein